MPANAFVRPLGVSAPPEAPEPPQTGSQTAKSYAHGEALMRVVRAARAWQSACDSSPAEERLEARGLLTKAVRDLERLEEEQDR